jgi:hypothetical protein
LPEETPVPQDPFGNTWSELEFGQARSLLKRTLAAAKEAGVRLILDFGTWLGHVRMGTMLPWDDDIDLAMVAGPGVGELTLALRKAGLQVVDGDTNPSFAKYLKVCDPSYAPVVWKKIGYTWPFIDIFPIRQDGDQFQHAWEEYILPVETVLPLQPASFLGLECWNFARPLEVLDTYYGNWRVKEVSTWWDHRNERQPAAVVKRAIVTGESGLKVDGIPPAVRASLARGEDPYWLGYYPGGAAFPAGGGS